MRTLICLSLLIGVIGIGCLGYVLGVDTVFGGRVSSFEYEGEVTGYTQYTGAIATTTEVKDGSGTFNSVIITEDFAGALVFYDATSTTAYSKTNGTRIADMQTASTEGVYAFDVWLDYGLIMESADGFLFAGDMTITYSN